jgi:DNA polymerase III epsilon subunit-like protein
MNNFLFFDTETTGVDLGSSRIVELAWLVYSPDGKKIKGKSYLIKPNGFKIPKESTKIHGISTKEALKTGKNLKDVLVTFKHYVEKYNISRIISHNIEFDINMIMNECKRTECYDFKEFVNSRKIKLDCSMLKGQKFMKVDKYPKLEELYKHLFKKELNQDHRALSDTKACAKCYFKIKKK